MNAHPALRASGFAALAAMLALTAACGDDKAKAKPKPIVALFANNAYVDYSVDGTVESEAANMEAILAAGGFTVRRFTGITAADFTAAVNGAVTLVIPEQEIGDLSTAIGAPARTVIRDFVERGGNLVVGRAVAWSIALVNGVFGGSLVGELGVVGTIDLVVADATGTPFEGGTTAGGTTLSAPSATDAIDSASLQSSTRVIYADGAGNAVVTLRQVGSGTVTILGYDYNDAAPKGAQDSGWRQVLLQAASAHALKPLAALFANDAYVDYSVDGAEESEAANMEAILAAGGYAVRKFTGITAADFTAAMRGAVTLVIPEQETGNLSAAIGAPEQTAIHDFVAGGGNLVVGSANARSTGLVDAVFGSSLVGGQGVSGSIDLRVANATGTPFEGGTGSGRTTLSSADATYAIDSTSLPASTRIIYADGSGNALVTLRQVGSGTVTILGYDYYDAAPTGAQDSGWRQALLQAASADAVEMQIPLTSVRTADVAARGWSTCFTALYDDATTMVAAALDLCTGTEMMVACREVGSDTLTLAAWGAKAEITVDTGLNADATNAVGGVGWYFSPDYSWGFASLGDTVAKDECDVDATGKNDQRLCWHTGISTAGQFYGGYRCGVTEDLNDSTAWERVLLQR